MTEQAPRVNPNHLCGMVGMPPWTNTASPKRLSGMLQVMIRIRAPSLSHPNPSLLPGLSGMLQVTERAPSLSHPSPSHLFGVATMFPLVEVEVEVEVEGLLILPVSLQKGMVTKLVALALTSRTKLESPTHGVLMNQERQPPPELLTPPIPVKAVTTASPVHAKPAAPELVHVEPKPREDTTMLVSVLQS